MNPKDKLLANIEDFPTLPTIYHNLMNAMSDPSSTVSDVADVITVDQSTTIKLLKFANSPMFGLTQKVDSISDAIFYIGFNEVRNIVISLSVMNLFDEFKSNLHFNIVDLWKHSIAVGTIARIYGESFGTRNLENYFVGGILHDIGKLLFIKSYNRRYLDLLEDVYENKNVLNKKEEEVFGFDHSQAGALMAKKWGLPGSIIKTIKHHHKGVSGDGFDRQTACVHLGNITANLLEMGSAGNDIVDRPNKEIWNELDVREDHFTGLHDRINLAYNDSIGILKL